MKIDPDLDCVVETPGQCIECGQETGQRYCSQCVTELSPDKNQVQAADWQVAKAELARRELARRHLIPFIQRIKPEYMAGWFHRDLAARLERFVRRVENQESPRMIINVPPRRGKTEQASKALPAWVLGKHPEWSFIATTHSDDLSIDNSRDVQAYLNSEEYQTLFPSTVLDKDNKGATGWRTTDGGIYKPAGVGKGIAGRGAHIFMIDDPHRDKDAYSAAVRASIWRWYKSSARTRLAPGGGMILIQTRWVLDDLTGRLIDEEGLIHDGGAWEQVVYPEEAIHDEYRLPNGRVISVPEEGATKLRKKDEPLHPERYDRKSNLEHKKDPITWAALYQQDPTAGEAGIYKASDFKEVLMADLPAKDELSFYTAWDTAVGRKDQHCNSAGITVGIDKDENFWLYDLIVGKWDGFSLTEIMIDNYFQFSQSLIGIEKTNHSVATEPFFDRRILERRAYGMATELIPHGNKDLILRSRPFQGVCKSGKVMVPTDAPWYDQFIKEMTEFPAGTLDDIVAACANLGQMLEGITSPHQTAKPKDKESWRDKVGKKQRSGGRNWRKA